MCFVWQKRKGRGEKFRLELPLFFYSNIKPIELEIPLPPFHNTTGAARYDDIFLPQLPFTREV